MQVLGFARTWRTSCFINPDCRKQVFAHTNGFGDFVLFDDLGWPWPIHACYFNRFCQRIDGSQNGYEIRADALAEYRSADEKQPLAKTKRTTRDISRAVPEDYIGEPDELVFGYVQDYIENRAERVFRDLGNVGQQDLRGILGKNRSQITIVTSEFESFTAYADLRNVVVKRTDMVAARLKAVRILGIPNTNAIFLCSDVLLVRGSPVS